MKQRNISFLLAVLLSIMGASAQSLVFHHAGGEKTTVQLPATFTVTPTGDKLVVDDGGGNVVELAKDEVIAGPFGSFCTCFEEGMVMMIAVFALLAILQAHAIYSPDRPADGLSDL